MNLVKFQNNDNPPIWINVDLISWIQPINNGEGTRLIFSDSSDMRFHKIKPDLVLKYLRKAAEATDPNDKSIITC